jgi:hypothetical protein
VSVYKTSNSGLLTKREYTSFLAGNEQFEPPSYESIQTVTVGAGGASTITFSSIPSTYTHLQIRSFIKGSSNDQDIWVNFNGDTTSNYSQHRLYGDGASAVSGGLASGSKIEYFGRSGSGTSVFGPSIVDILDYKDTNKFKTIRSLTGWDNNGSGFVMFTSGNWRLTSAITSMVITPQSGTFAQYSSFALYGIK